MPPVLVNKQTDIINPQTANVPKLWLRIMQSIHGSFIDSKYMDMIIKLIHDALYMGQMARHYQINIWTNIGLTL